jgi:hypothetical protein
MTEYEVVETGQRLNGVELDCQLFFGVWGVRDRVGETWHVRTRSGESLTVQPVE